MTAPKKFLTRDIDVEEKKEQTDLRKALKREKEQAGKAFEKAWKNVTDKQDKKPPNM